MRRLLHGSLVWTVLLLPASLPLLAGCGGGEKVGDIQDSEQVKAADESGQKAMEEFMRSQTKKGR